MKFKGEQMVLPMNEIGTHVSCLGNHDLVGEGSSRIWEKTEPGNSIRNATFLGC